MAAITCITDLEDGDVMRALDHAIHVTGKVTGKAAGMHIVGKSWLRKFERSKKDIAMINKAIAALKEAERLTEEDHAGKAGRLSDLGNAFLARFQRLGETGDVDNAIKSFKDAVTLTPDGDPDKPAYLTNVGSSLARFKRFEEINNINVSISILKSAVGLTPYDHADRPVCLTALGRSFLARFQHGGDVLDIDSSIKAIEAAVQLTPDGHIDRAASLSSLGNAFLARFQHFGNMTDIEKGVSNLRDAV